MGYLVVLGPCWACGRVFHYSPERVPSLVVGGVREPICRDCIDRANPRRVASGLPPVVPLPGAYEPDEVAE